MSREVTKVALIGMGTVGTGVARLLIDHGDRTARHAGRTLWVESVVVQDVKKARDYELPNAQTKRVGVVDAFHGEGRRRHLGDR